MNINETISIRHTVAEEVVLRIDARMLSPYIVSIYGCQTLLLDGQMNNVYFIFWKISPAINSICVFFWSKWTRDVVLLSADSKPQITIWQRPEVPLGYYWSGPRGISQSGAGCPQGKGELDTCLYTVLQLQISPAHTPALATSQDLACFWIDIHGYHNTVRCAVANISMNCCVTMPIGKRSKEQRLCP